MTDLTWVSPTDVLNRWTGTDDKPDTDDTVFTTLIEDAQVLIQTRFPNIQDRIDDNKLNTTLIKIVVSAMVQRAYQTIQNGLSSYSYGTGPFSESGSFSTPDKRGLYLTQDEIDLLTPNNLKSNKAFSINLDIHHKNFTDDIIVPFDNRINVDNRYYENPYWGEV